MLHRNGATLATNMLQIIKFVNTLLIAKLDKLKKSVFYLLSEHGSSGDQA